MAARNVYTVCGFCPELDWKPTAFVGPIPPCKVCAWCGVVPMSGWLLPCGELLCPPCREKSGSCPVHGTKFAEDELVMSTFLHRHMMQRKVYCWSTCCNKTGTVSAMLEHYEKDCPYRSGPPRYQKGNVESVRRHTELKHASGAAHEQNAQNALGLSGNSTGAKLRKGEPLSDGDAEHADGPVEDNSAVGSIKVSHSIELSTTHSEPREVMHTSIHMSVNTSALHESATSGFADNDSSSTHSRKAVEEAHVRTQTIFKNEHAHDDVQGIQQSNTKRGTNSKATDADNGGHIDETATFRARPRVQSSAGYTSIEQCKQDTHVKGKEASGELSTNAVPLLLRDMPETKTGHIGTLHSLKLDLETALAATKECIEKHPEDVSSLRKHEEKIRECIYEVVNACKAILQASLKASESCEWYVRNYDQVKKKTLQHECCSVGSSSPFYLRGYNIKPSVLLLKRKGIIEFHAELTLYKGLYDDFVRWPFQESCKLTLLHPSDVTKNIVFCMTGANEPGYIAYLKPRGMKNVSVHANEHRSLKEIEEEGFASDNKLHFRFEVSSV
nr:uncharacterized protein LOC126546942 [Dermacentor andersoni]